MEWKADLHELDGLRRWYGKQPRLVRIAAGRMLNDFAFGTRTRAIGVIGDTMTVRNPKFVASRLRVTKANIHSPVERQAAWAGSVAGNRFTGWVEQEKGTPTKRNRFATLAGRGGSAGKQIRHAVRLKKGRDVVKPEDADYNPKGGSFSGFAAMIFRKKENRIILYKGTFYKRKRKKLEVVQSTKKRQPKRLTWLRRARAQYFRHTDLDALWRRHCNSVMRAPSKL